MTKKYLVGLLVILLAIGVVLYRWQRQEDKAGPAIAALPPAQALAFIAWPGWPQAWNDLRRTKYFQQVTAPAFWQTALGAEGYMRLMAGKQQLEQQLGFPITEQTVDQMLNREGAVAFIPRAQGAWAVDVVAYLRVSAAEKIAENLARLWPSQDLARETRTVDAVEIITLRPEDLPSGISYAFLGNLVVASTDAAWVVDAIQAAHGTASPRLHTIPPVQAMQIDRTESLLAYGYYDAEGLQAQMTAALPTSAVAPPPEALQLLQTANKMSLKAVRAADGLRLETMALYPSGAPPQAFRRTEGEGATPPFRGVPAETFYLTHVDLLNLQGLWQMARQFAALGAQGALEQWLTEFREHTGVDLEREVLPVFTGVVGVGITSPLGSQAGSPIALPGFFLTFGVTDEPRARQLVQTVGGNVAGPLFTQFLQRLPHDGQEILYLGHPLLFIKPGYMVRERQLIVGSDVSVLQHMLDAATGRTRALADTNAFQEMRRHIRLKGGSVTFVDLPMILSRVKEWWARIEALAQVLTRGDQSQLLSGAMTVDPWKWLDLLRPIRYVGAVSQGEAQGIRTEVFIALEDLK
jgi:hypothetical protein